MNPMIPEWCVPDDLPNTGGSLSIFVIALATLAAGAGLITFTRWRGAHGTAALLIGLTMAVATIGFGARTTNAAPTDECPPGYHAVPSTVVDPTDPPVTEPPVTDGSTTTTAATPATEPPATEPPVTPDTTTATTNSI